MITIKQGNLLHATENIIAHQVNCKGVMGSGVALAIRNTYPPAYNAFIAKGAGDHHLGDAQIVQVGSDKYVANLYGQLTYGRTGMHTNYEGLRKAMSVLAQYARNTGYSVAFPYGMGAVRGGGDWAVIQKMIIDEFKDIHVAIYQLDAG